VLKESLYMDTPSTTESLDIDKFTSSEMGAWSNAYLIKGEREAILFDVFMLKADTTNLVQAIKATGRKLTTVFVSHAHPDHFMGLEVICDAFDGVSVLSTPNVSKDIASDGPWIIKILQQKLGKDGPGRFVVPDVMTTGSLSLEGKELEVIEYPECESKHIATLYIPSLQAHLTSDIVYHHAHCYLQERHLESWIKRLDELEQFVAGRVTTLYPGHGEPGNPAVLIRATRTYLEDFAAALPEGNASALSETMLTKYPTHHAKQFLTVFSIPAYFPTKTPT
jgi:glyoxylase-like metal-dependent hydrolase (beta-lactamase superfamily II)